LLVAGHGVGVAVTGNMNIGEKVSANHLPNPQSNSGLMAMAMSNTKAIMPMGSILDFRRRLMDTPAVSISLHNLKGVEVV
jgi:hypothetical protein